MEAWLKRCPAVLCVVAVTLVIMGCDDSDSSSGGGTGTGTGVEGDWQARGGGFSSTMHIDASGNSLSGVVVFDGNSDPLTGTVEGNTVTMRSHNTSGTGTIEGDSMSGTYRQDNGNGGSWSATRM